MVTWQNRHIIGRAQPVPRKAVPNVAPPPDKTILSSELAFYLYCYCVCAALEACIVLLLHFDFVAHKRHSTGTKST